LRRNIEAGKLSSKNFIKLADPFTTATLRKQIINTVKYIEDHPVSDILMISWRK